MLAFSIWPVLVVRQCSNSAAPSPCTTPPRICSSTSSGLRTVPQSSTTQCRSSRMNPVSVSTSSHDACAPLVNANGYSPRHVMPHRHQLRLHARPAAYPAGNRRCAPARAASCRSRPVVARPPPRRPPGRAPRAAACSMLTRPASSVLSRSAQAACHAASPPMPAPRDAQVPPPYGVASVSPSMTRTRAGATPSAVATICASTAPVPWPCSVTLAWQITTPCASNRTVAPSCAEIRAPPTP